MRGGGTLFRRALFGVYSGCALASGRAARGVRRMWILLGVIASVCSRRGETARGLSLGSGANDDNCLFGTNLRRHNRGLLRYPQSVQMV